MRVERDDPEPLDADEFARWWKETGEHELRQILFWKWDPIGVSDIFPNTADDYDGYAPPIVSALRKGAIGSTRPSRSRRHARTPRRARASQGFI